jgi:hypothetical protein
LSIRSGTDYVGKPKDFASKTFDEFNRLHYHQPSDEFRDDWRFDGVVQLVETSFAIGMPRRQYGQIAAL